MIDLTFSHRRDRGGRRVFSSIFFRQDLHDYQDYYSPLRHGGHREIYHFLFAADPDEIGRYFIGQGGRHIKTNQSPANMKHNLEVI